MTAPSAALVCLATAFVAAAPVAASAEDRFETISGSVTMFSAARHELAIRDESGTERRFAWTKDTKFNGVVAEGARVSVRFSRAPAGSPAQVLSISVLK